MLDAVEEDFTDILYKLLKRASAAGMLPNDFWEHEPADVIDYVEGYEEAQSRQMYCQSAMTSRFIAVQMGNMFSKTSHKIPTYEELFETEPKPKTLDNRIEEIRKKFGGKVHGS